MPKKLLVPIKYFSYTYYIVCQPSSCYKSVLKMEICVCHHSSFPLAAFEILCMEHYFECFYKSSKYKLCNVNFVLQKYFSVDLIISWHRFDGVKLISYNIFSRNCFLCFLLFTYCTGIETYHIM